MAELVMTHRRYSSRVGGTVSYNIEITVESGDDATSTTTPRNLFVKTIVSGGTDTFARVATLADLDVLSAARDIAIASGDTEYRTSVVTLSFSDIDTAIAAVPVIRDRVNNLVKAWNAAYVDFTTDNTYPLQFDLPLDSTSATEREELSQEYVTARDARIEEEAKQEELQAEYEALQTATETQIELQELKCDIADDLNTINALVPELTSQVSDALSALDRAAMALQKMTRVLYTGAVNAGSTSTTVNATMVGSPTHSTLVGNIMLVRTTPVQVRAITGSGLTSFSTSANTPFSPTPAEDDVIEIRAITEALGYSDDGLTASSASTLREYQTKLANGLVSEITTAYSTYSGLCTAAASLVDAARDSEALSLRNLDAQRNIVLQAQQAEQAALAELNDRCPDLDVGTL